MTRDYEIRPVAPHEWRQSRDLRLRALQDPLAPIAFGRTHAEESVLLDEEWQRRAGGVGAQQFVVVAGDDEARWVGLTVVVIERPDYVCVNAVYLAPEARGSGLAGRLLTAAVTWAWERTDRVHLWVHEKNARAEALYRRVGFERTGQTMPSPVDPSATEYELALTRP